MTSPAAYGPSAGADPAEVAAANCTLGFDEQRIHPLSVIALALLATPGTLMLVRRRRSGDALASHP